MGPITFSNPSDALSLGQGPVKLSQGTYLYPKDPSLIGKTSYTYNPPTQKSSAAPTVNPYQSTLDEINRQLEAFKASYVPLPQYDVSGAYERARNEAAASVNPYFASEVSKYVALQDTIKQNRQKSYELGMGNLQATYEEFIKGSETNKTRTGEDYQMNMQNTAQQEQLRQEAEAQKADIEQRALQGQLGEMGYQGAGKQKLIEQAKMRMTGEKAAQQEVRYKSDVYNLTKTRSLEDIASGVESKTREKGYTEKSMKLDLDQFMAEKEAEIFNYKSDMETKRIRQIMENTESIYKTNTYDWLKTIKDPRQYSLAASTYL